jgi:hypothetical protein
MAFVSNMDDRNEQKSTVIVALGPRKLLGAAKFGPRKSTLRQIRR